MLSGGEQRMGRYGALCNSALKGLNRCIGKWCGLAAGAADDCQHARHTQHARTIVAIDANEEVAGKERLLERDFGAIAPFALIHIDGQKMIDLALGHMLGDALLMAAGRVDSKPG